MVAVTGAAGRVGSACIRALAERGDAVIAIDRKRGEGPGSWRQADLTDAAAARRAMDGATHLIQLAGHTAPDPARPNAVLLDNVSIAANTLAALVEEGGAAAVTASSTSAYGFAYAREILAPLYLPIDEDHACRPEETYGLSKVTLEQLGAMWSRATGLTSVMLRFPAVFSTESERIRFLSDVAKDPCDSGRRNMWSYIYVADLVDAIVRALEVSDGQAHVLNVASPSVTDVQNLTGLAAGWFPSVERRANLDESGVFDTTRARDLLGWMPSRRFDS